MPGELRLSPQISIESLTERPFRFVNSLVSTTGSRPAAASAAPGESAKRLVDLVLGSALLLAAAPFVAAMAVAVALGGGRPFYGHERVGRGGRSFRCWKIRTMRTDAAERLEDLLRIDPVARRQWIVGRKLADDPRTTRLGRLLRRTSLDELPQFWNVVTGEMSLVGPRPVTREELGRYGAGVGHYVSVRPGITGPWQVYRRADTSYEERVAMDCAYVEGRTLRQDALLLALTLRVPFLATGRR